MWVKLKRWCMLCMWSLQRGHSGDGCDLASTLCKYDLRNGDLLFWVGQGFDKRGGKYLFRDCNVCWRCAQYFIIASFVKLSRDNIGMYMAHICFYVSCSNCVAAVVKDGFSLGVLKYVVCVCKGVMYVIFYVCNVRRRALSTRVGSVSVLSCRCCMFVSCVHPVAVLMHDLKLVNGKGILQSSWLPCR